MESEVNFIDALDLLEWQLELGVTETIGNQEVNRYLEVKPKSESETKANITSKEKTTIVEPTLVASSIASAANSLDDLTKAISSFVSLIKDATKAFWWISTSTVVEVPLPVSAVAPDKVANFGFEVMFKTSTLFIPKVKVANSALPLTVTETPVSLVAVNLVVALSETDVIKSLSLKVLSSALEASVHEVSEAFPEADTTNASAPVKSTVASNGTDVKVISPVYQ